MKKMAVLLAALLLLTMAGCGAQKGKGPVYTDWSKLTPYEPTQQKFTYHAGYRTDGVLEARDDYGVLLPYIGKYSTMERYVIDALPIYGLVTDRGELVSDPIYARVDFYDDFLVLYHSNSEGEEQTKNTFSCTIAASDGRWVRAMPDAYYIKNGCGLLMTATDDGSLDLWNANGESVMHFAGSLFTPKLGAHFKWNEEGGAYLDWADDKVGYVVCYTVNGEYVDQGVRLYLDFTNGTVTDAPPAGYPDEIDYSVYNEAPPEVPEVENCNYLDPITDLVSGEIYFAGYVVEDESKGSVCTLFDRTGKPLVENIDLVRFERSPIVRAGLCATVEDGCFCFRSAANNKTVFRYAMRTNSD